MDKLALSIGELLGISGTIAFLVAACICALWSIWFNRIKEGQKAEFQKQIEEQKAEFLKQLENLKAKNEKINYISKTQFDAEFKMYKELSELSYNVKILFIDYLKRMLDSNFDTEFVNSYKNVSLEIINFQKILFSYAPFISKELYEHFENYRVYLNEIIDFVKQEAEKQMKNGISEHIEKICNIKFERIEQLHRNIVDNLRAYLHSLKIIED